MSRAPTHTLSRDQRVIVEGVHASPQPVTRLVLARKYGRTVIDRLIDTGHLTEGLTPSGRDCIIPTDMTVSEIDNYFTRL